MRVALGLLLGALLTQTPARGDQLLWADRLDTRVPEKCRDPQTAAFSSVQKLIIYGIRGAIDHGFTHEIDMARSEATLLWDSLKTPGAHPPTGSLSSTYAFLVSAKQTMGFDFMKEGDVLEALALQDLEREYPVEQFFTTGGISYHNSAGTQFETLGEVDVVVGRKSDCAIVAIGEAKLGLPALHHAHQQVARFIQYLKQKLCANSATHAPVCGL